MRVVWSTNHELCHCSGDGTQHCEGRLPLHEACTTGSVPMVRWLLKHGGDTTADVIADADPENEHWSGALLAGIVVFMSKGVLLGVTVTFLSWHL
jgi:hypothetical protein